jgi:hypothetical protein
MACSLDKLTKLLDIDPNSVVGYGDKVKMPCPLHGGSDANMFVNLEGEGWYCHSVCQRGGKLTDLVAEYRNITTKEASMLLRGTATFVSDGKAAPKKDRLILHPPNDPNKHLPSGIALEGVFRRIKVETLEHFGVYLGTYGRWNDRIIIPLYNETGEYVGFQARRMYDHETIGKYVFSPGVKSGLILYNYNNTKDSKLLYVVEGAFGVMNFWQHGVKNVVGLVGGGFGPKRIQMLKAHDVIVCVDNDLAGDAYRNKIADAGISVVEAVVPPLGVDFDRMTTPWFDRLIHKRIKTCKMKALTDRENET